jgi:hypothetical protein
LGRLDQVVVRPAFTLLKVPLTLVPSEVTIVMQAIKMSASITAYSTAVGPSSLVRNRQIRDVKVFIEALLLELDPTVFRV